MHRSQDLPATQVGIVAGPQRRAAPASPLPTARPTDTLVSVARWRAATLPDNLAYTFLVDGEAEAIDVSYAEMDRRARAVAAELARRGAGGERVILLFEPGVDFAVSLFGCLYAGAVAVPAYPPDPLRLARTLPRLEGMLRNAGAFLIFSSAAILHWLEGPLAEWCRVPALAMESITRFPSDWEPPELEPHQLAILQYTSGSTGSPRGVMLSHANLMHNLAVLNRLDSPTPSGVCWLPPYHDMGLAGGILWPMFSGGRNVLMDPVRFLERPLRWLLAISRYRAETTGGPNFAYELCVRKIKAEECRDLDLSPWQVAINGAEPVRPGTLERFIEKFRPFGFRPETFYPAYGLAESTVLAAGGRRDDPPVVRAFSARGIEANQGTPVDPADEDARLLVGSGEVIPGGELRIVDPDTRRLLPPGSVGEIWINSPSIGGGYFGRDELTDELFRAHTADEMDGPYLRTGDLGFVDRGELFITGRLKELIILAGRNYYPQDVELAAQRAHPALKPDAGAAFAIDADGQEQLVLVHEVLRPNKVDLAEVLLAIRRELIEACDVAPWAVALIPSASLPKTSSGKIRRRACRDLFLAGELPALAEWRLDAAVDAARTSSENRDPPQTPTEEDVARLFCDVLGLESVGRSDDFFAFGGHSLRAVQLLGRVNDRFGTGLGLDALFERPTVAGMAEAVEAEVERPGADDSAAAARRSIPPRPADAPAVLSAAERRLWFFDQLQPGHPFYNMPVAARLQGPLDAAALRRAWDRLSARHAALRTTYVAARGQPRRRVTERLDVPFGEIDLRSMDPLQRERELSARLREEARRPFRLSTGPLARSVLFRLADDEAVLLWAMHHIITDGWSVGVMARELGSLYVEETGGPAAALPEVPLDYADFAVWQDEYVERELLGRELPYWRSRLGDEPPALELPLDRPRPAVQSFEGATHRFALSAELSQGLRELAARERTTLFAVLLAGLDALLARYCRQEDVAVGTIVANRTRPQLEHLVGFFANTLVLRTDVSGDPTFRELIARAARVTLDAYRRQELPFDTLVEQLSPQRHRNRAPLFQAALVLENMPLKMPEVGGLQARPIYVDCGTSKYDLALLVTEEDDRLIGHLEYATALFDPETAEQMAASLRVLFEAAVADPERVISRLPLLGPHERQATIEQSARAAPAGDGEACLHQLFENGVAAGPERVALCEAGREWTYAELNRWADRAAAALRRAGIGPEQPAAVHLPRSAELVAAMLGVMKSGGAYVPLDPDQPEQRIARLLEDTGAPVVITRTSLQDRLPESNARVVLIDALAQDEDEPDEQLSPAAVNPSQLAYVLYTSGSTGQPKGVLIEHRAAASFVRAFNRELRLGPESRVLHLFAPSSDGSISDVFSALAAGGRLVLAPAELLDRADGLEDLVERQQVDTATLTPSMMRLMDPAKVPTLRTVCAVGEALSPELAAAWATGRRLVVGYGVTEAACGACLGDWRDSAGEHPAIGRPLEGVHLHLLDEHGEPVPIGVVGEIWLGGVQVGRGYLNLPERTAESFVPDPFTEEPGARLYRTGDLGRRRRDGTIEFLGRRDDQLNLHGHRVEPSEIAARLEEHPLIEQAAVMARDDGGGLERLVAYLAPTEGRVEPLRGAVPQVRQFLRRQLPRHMVPAAFVVLEKLPRSVQGKIDRRALPPPSAEDLVATAQFIASRDEQESLVAEVWQQVLRVERVGALDDFFELGGHSMAAVQVVAEIERRTGRRLPLALLFGEPTVERLAEFLRRPEPQPAETSLVPLTPTGRGRPFFCIHPAGGTVFCYRALAERLGAGRPFYGLQAVGIDGVHPPHARLEDMAAHYAEAIREVQPAGPYLLGGWSLGGILAFETARLLSEQGHEIGLLALFDAAAMYPDRPPDERDFLPMIVDFFPDLENLPLEAIRRMPPEEQLGYFLDRAAEAELVAAREPSAGDHVFEVFKTSTQAMLDYRQKPLPGKITLFLAEHLDGVWDLAGDASLGWEPWAGRGVEVHRVPGNHIRMMQEPQVAALAEELRRCLEAVDPVR